MPISIKILLDIAALLGMYLICATKPWRLEPFSPWWIVSSLLMGALALAAMLVWA